MLSYNCLLKIRNMIQHYYSYFQVKVKAPLAKSFILRCIWMRPSLRSGALTLIFLLTD